MSDLIETVGDQENSTIETDDLTEEQVQEYKEKIQDLVSSNEENFAIDLVRSINSPRLYEELLKDCSIDEGGTPILQNWWQDNEDKDLRPFFLELVAYCPEEASIDSSLQRELITKLNLSFCQSLSNVDGLSNLTNLTYLSLNVCSSLSNVDGLNNLTNLTELYINYSTSLTNVDGLSKLTNLRELDLHNCGSLSNVDGLSNLPNLTELYLEGCESLAEDQIDDLKAALPSAISITKNKSISHCAYRLGPRVIVLKLTKPWH